MAHYHISLIITLVEMSIIVGSFLYILFTQERITMANMFSGYNDHGDAVPPSDMLRIKD